MTTEQETRIMKAIIEAININLNSQIQAAEMLRSYSIAIIKETGSKVKEVKPFETPTITIEQLLHAISDDEQPELFADPNAKERKRMLDAHRAELAAQKKEAHEDMMTLGARLAAEHLRADDPFCEVMADILDKWEAS